jgi:hypothetical protein
MRRPTKPSAIDVPRRAPISRPYHHRPSALATSHEPHHLPVPMDALSAPSLHRSRSSSDRHRRPPPQAAAESIPTPSVSTSRAPVSSSSFPTPSPAKGATGAAQFRRAAPPSMPRDYIASPSFFPGSFS